METVKNRVIQRGIYELEISKLKADNILFLVGHKPHQTENVDDSDDDIQERIKDAFRTRKLKLQEMDQLIEELKKAIRESDV